MSFRTCTLVNKSTKKRYDNLHDHRMSSYSVQTNSIIYEVNMFV